MSANPDSADGWYRLGNACHDQGCGTGLLGAELAPAGAHIIGVDLSAEMLRQA